MSPILKRSADSLDSSPEQETSSKRPRKVKEILSSKQLIINQCKHIELCPEIQAALKLLVAGYHSNVEIDMTKMGSQHKRRFRQALKQFALGKVRFNFKLKADVDDKIMVITPAEQAFAKKSTTVNNLSTETIADLESLIAGNRTNVEINVAKQRGSIVKRTRLSVTTFADLHKVSLDISKLTRENERILIVTLGEQAKGQELLRVSEFKEDQTLSAEMTAELESLVSGTLSKLEINITPLSSSHKKRFLLALKTFAVQQKTSASVQNGRLHVAVKTQGNERVVAVTVTGQTVTQV